MISPKMDVLCILEINHILIFQYYLVHLYVPHSILIFKLYLSTTGRTLYLHLVKLD